MEGEAVKNEVEAKVVVETPAAGGVSKWLGAMMGLRNAGAM